MTYCAVADFPGYVVRDDGAVLRGHRVLSTDVRNGYLRVKLGGPDGRRVWRPVHLLVLESFVGPRPSPRHHGAHGDGDKSNNRLDNLAWKLPKENEADKRLHGTTSKGGPRRPTHPLRVRAIVRRALSGESCTRIGERYGLHRASVSKIVRRLGVRVASPAKQP